jgi:hypothetical protein
MISNLRENAENYSTELRTATHSKTAKKSGCFKHNFRKDAWIAENKIFNYQPLNTLYIYLIIFKRIFQAGGIAKRLYFFCYIDFKAGVWKNNVKGKQ